MTLSGYATEQDLLKALVGWANTPKDPASQLTRQAFNRFVKARAEKRSGLNKDDFRQRRTKRKMQARDRARNRRVH
jgi:hypothetical protein